MAKILPNEWKVIEDALQLGGGSVLNFKNLGLRNFVYSSIQVDIEDENNPKFYENFEDRKLLSKGKRLKELIRTEDDQKIGKLFSDFYEGYKNESRSNLLDTESKYDWSNFNNIIHRLRGIVVLELFNTNIEDNSIQNRLKHAETLFLEAKGDFEKLRNACETISLILEPLRTEIEKSEYEKDIKDFFNIVNNFTIRHNKRDTKKIEYEEQFEWVFYMGYHTIKLYYSLKERNTTSPNKSQNPNLEF
jgi:hypothetical protein